MTPIQNLGKLSDRDTIVVLLVLATLESVMEQDDGIGLGMVPKRKDPESWVYVKNDVIRSFSYREPMVRMKIKQDEIEFALDRLGDKRGLAVLDSFGLRAILPVVKKTQAKPLVPNNFDINLVDILRKSGWIKGDEKKQVKDALTVWNRH